MILLKREIWPKKTKVGLQILDDVCCNKDNRLLLKPKICFMIQQ